MFFVSSFAEDLFEFGLGNRPVLELRCFKFRIVNNEHGVVVGRNS